MPLQRALSLIRTLSQVIAGADWAEAQVKVHRNYDVVKKLRALAGAKPGSLLLRFGMKRKVIGRDKSSVSEMRPKFLGQSKKSVHLLTRHFLEF